MNKRSLLLEIGLEEMPARFLNNGISLLQEKVKNWLEDHNIDHGEIKSFSTPRRLAVLIKDVAESQPDTEEEAKGPAKKIALDNEGNWSKAAIGFSKGHGMSPDDIYFLEIKGVEYAHVKKFIEGKLTLDLLPELEQVVAGMHFPKAMRWGDLDLRYARPIRWITALFGSDVIPFSIAGVEASSETQGHRFLGEKMRIIAPEDYEKVMLGQYVIADYDERKHAIIQQIDKLGEEKNWTIPIDEDLLEEVTNLVEYPTVFSGEFNEEFLKLPEEVLITSMKSHQRYFPVKDKQGNLLANFVAVRNGDHRHLETVARGNEKVLRARLADADFFYTEDQKLNIDEAAKKLESIVYHEKIGTLSEKVVRIRKIANLIGDFLNISDEERKLTDRAASISKFDLVTNMVNEFPELQGVMGEKYAIQKGEKKEVAEAINEHYKPRHADDSIPASNIGAIVATADKLDTIVSAFAIGLIPTGSQDPYALRRQAAGIIHILLEKRWKISLSDLLTKVTAIIREDITVKNENMMEDLLSFFKLRIKHVLQENGIRYDINEAVLSGELGAIPSLLERANVLNNRKDDEDFKDIVEALARVINISGKAENDQVIDPTLFENEHEQKLYECYKELNETMHKQGDMDVLYSALASLKPVITNYFDHIMVMADDVQLKKNRLAQMKNLAELITAFANMNEVQVK